VHENAQVIPFYEKEGIGAVDGDAHAGIHHPPAPSSAEEGTYFPGGKKPNRSPKRTVEGMQMQKDVKMNGTNYVKSFRINKDVKKTNSKRTGFYAERRLIEVKTRANIEVRSEELPKGRRLENGGSRLPELKSRRRGV
jgi:hypothetical protein